MGNLQTFQTHKWLDHYSKNQILDAIAFQNLYQKQLWKFQDQLKNYYQQFLQNRQQISNNFDQYLKEWQKQNTEKVQNKSQFKQFCTFIKKNKEKMNDECFSRLSYVYFDQFEPKFLNKKIQLALFKYEIGKKAQINHQKEKICKELKINVEEFNQQIILHKNKVKTQLNEAFQNQIQKFKQYCQKQINDLLSKMQILQNILNNFDYHNINQNIFDQNGSFIQKYSQKSITKTCSNTLQ